VEVSTVPGEHSNLLHSLAAEKTIRDQELSFVIDYLIEKMLSTSMRYVSSPHSVSGLIVEIAKAEKCLQLAVFGSP